MNWKLNEPVYIWSTNSEGFMKGMVKSIDKTLGVFFFNNGKTYNYNLDGTAIDPVGITNQRVFSVRQLNTVVPVDSVQDAM